MSALGRIILLAADDDDADAFVMALLAMPNTLRTGRGAVDPYEVAVTTVTPADDMAARLDPMLPIWERRTPIKIMRTDRWPFRAEVVAKLAVLAARHRGVLDPTGLLGPRESELAAKRGFAADDRTAPMGTMVQQNRPRQRNQRPITSRISRSVKYG